MRAANPNHVVISFSREIVESRNMKKALSMMNHIIKTREVILATESSVMLKFGGWDEDPREIWEIPEIRRFMKKLTDQFPYWFWYLRKDDESLKLLLSILIEGERSTVPGGSMLGPRAVGFAIDADSLKRIMFKLFDGLNTLTDTHNIAETENISISNEVSTLINQMLDGE